MTDDNMDVENYETADAEDAAGGGGYVDDDIDLDDDDDDDDEPLVSPARQRVANPSPAPAANTSTAIPTTSLAKSKKRLRPLAASPLRKSSQQVLNDVLPTDYKLRAAGVKNVREFVVSRFYDGVPPWNAADGQPNHMRLYRDGEKSVDRRKDALEAFAKDKKFMQSYRGQRSEARRQKQGYVTVPSRFRREWKLEVAPETVSKRLVAERQVHIEKRLKLEDGSAVDADKGDEDEENDTDEPTTSDLKNLVTTYTGQFNGRASNPRYVVMVVDDDKKMIDVMPVGEFAMFSFRTDQKATTKSAEEVEDIAKKLRAKREKDPRLNHFTESIMGKHMERELMMGDRAILAAMPDVYEAGIKRGAPATKEEDEFGAEAFDFEPEFDNDDLILVDKEEVTKPVKMLLVDEEKRKKDFQKMIKDESEVSKENSESEGELARQEKEEPTIDGKSATTNVPPSRNASPNISSSARQQLSPSLGTASVSGKRGAGASPSSATTRRGGTPQMLDLSHLLPPPGALPTEKHVRAVLTELLKDKREVTFREFFRYFEHKTKEQKKNMMGILKNVALVRKKPDKTVVISWRT